MFNQFTDFAAKMGWEYTLFDAGWWDPGLKPIAAYATAKGILPLPGIMPGTFTIPKNAVISWMKWLPPVFAV